MFRMILISIINLSPFFGNAQTVTIENLTSTQKGEVTFDYLVKSDHSTLERYNLFIYTTADNYQVPLEISIVDVVPDELHSFSFNSAQYLPVGYSGALRIKLKAVATRFPVEIKTYSKKAKPEGKFELVWEDAERGNRYDVLLIRDGQATTIAQGITTLSYSGTFPKSLSKGKYLLQVIPQMNTKNASQEVDFTMMPKFGWVLKVSSGALILSGAGFLIANKEDGISGGQLPVPPSPPFF